MQGLEFGRNRLFIGYDKPVFSEINLLDVLGVSDNRENDFGAICNGPRSRAPVCAFLSLEDCRIKLLYDLFVNTIAKVCSW